MVPMVSCRGGSENQVLPSAVKCDREMRAAGKSASYSTSEMGNLASFMPVF